MEIESNLQRKVINYLKAKRVFFFRYTATGQQNGLPDIICLYKGFFLGLELKADNGKPTLLQLKKLKAINDNGGIGKLITSVEQVDDILRWIDMKERSNHE